MYPQPCTKGTHTALSPTMPTLHASSAPHQGQEGIDSHLASTGATVIPDTPHGDLSVHMYLEGEGGAFFLIPSTLQPLWGPDLSCWPWMLGVKCFFLQQLSLSSLPPLQIGRDFSQARPKTVT